MTTVRPLLLVEDSANDRELMLEALREHRLVNRVDVARNGEEALQYLRREGPWAARPPEDPAVVLLDLKMPKVDGLEVLRVVKGDERLRSHPHRHGHLVAGGAGPRPELPARGQRVRRQTGGLPRLRGGGEGAGGVLGGPERAAPERRRGRVSTPLRFVHVEDSEADAELIRETLIAEGFDCSVMRVETREAFHDAIGREAFDLVISDFSLPAFDGLSALAIALERKPGTPFILVSGTLGEEQAIESLKRGATDYVLKHRLSRLGPAVRRALEEARTRRERQRAEEAETVLAAQLRQAQKMEALGQFAGGIAHDFNNLLTVVMASADLIRVATPPEREDLLSSLRDLAEAAARGRQLIKKLLSFSRRESLSLRRVDLGQVVQEAVGTFRHLLPTSIDVGLVVAPDLPPVAADAGAIEQILLNLASNARDALPEGGRLHVTVERVTAPLPQARIREMEPGDYVHVSVRDNGTGMDEATRMRVFEPLFTTKPAGKGTGLGMAMVLSLVRQHRGLVNVESAPGRGTKIDLYFPAAGGGEQPGATAETSALLAPGGSETILVADDDPAVRRVCVRALTHFGHRVLAAADGAEALTILRAHDGDVQLIISDMMMPKMTGLELYQRLRSEGRASKFLFTSGDELSVRELAADPGLRVLQKPWTIEELAGAVREFLGAPAAS